MKLSFKVFSSGKYHGKTTALGPVFPKKISLMFHFEPLENWSKGIVAQHLILPIAVGMVSTKGTRRGG
ncbi:MAG: hypothetical protein JXR34_07880 [Bacteroidales bacterium]|nr:hypothetical protein [Bacteroidales bacterium]